MYGAATASRTPRLYNRGVFDEPFRRHVQPVLRPVARGIAHAGLTANHITALTFLVTIVAAAAIATGRTWIGLAFWLISRLGDGLDGVVARESGQASAFGGYLDITLDMAGYAAMVIGFALLYPMYYAAWVSVLAGYVVVITTTLALSDAAGKIGRSVSATNRTFQFTPGITEAGETTVMYCAWVVFPGAIVWLVWLWVAALAATGAQRTALAWRALR